MGEVRVKVIVRNEGDVLMAIRGILDAERIRQATVEAIVDTGAMTSVIPEPLARELGLIGTKTKRYVVADGRSIEAHVTEPVEFEFIGRTAFESCAVMGDEVLIGQLFLEQTDLFVDAAGQRLVGHPDHPDEVLLKIRHLASA